MATDFTQDTVLQFLQSRGGSVRNSDLLLHFRNFIRDHADRDRNRELFKRFVNSLATVQQIDGASYVVLRRKFRGHVPGGGGKGDSSEPPVRPTRKSSEPSREKAGLTSAAGAVKPQHTLQQREVITPAPPGVTAGKSILPAAGIMLNNNNNSMDTNLNLKHKQQEVINTQEEPVRPSVGVSHTPVLSQPPPQDQDPTVGQRRVGVGPPAGSTAGGPLRHTSQQVPEPLRPREASLQPQVRLHQDPPVLHAVPHAHVAPRRIRHRPSYKSAVSFDDDDDDEEEEEEQVPVRRGSAGGAWPLSVPLGDMGRAISTSSPCIIDPPAPPSAASPSSSERMVPRIHIQNVKGEMVPPGGPGWSLESRVGQGGDWARLGPGPGPGSGPGPVVGSIPEDWTSTRRSLPFEAERYVPSPERAEEAPPCRAVQPEPRPGSGRSQRLSSSHSSIFSPSSNAGFPSSDWSLSGSPRGSEWNSSYEDLQARTGMSEGGAKTQEVVQRAQEPRFEFGGDGGVAVPRHRFIDHLHDDQESTAHLPQFHPALGRLEARANVLPWHLSTGDLCDDHEGAESSDGSTSSPPLRQRPGVARRLSSKLRSRMCRSMGADLDQVLQEVGGGEGGSEAARLNRLHLISSTLNLRYNLSSSSLSSCSTPPRCHSHADLLEGMEGGGGRRGSLSTASPSTAQHEAPSRQSLVPLEPREHTWLVKGAAGAWPDIYSLFREDSSLLNRRDFISGFTVLHWIAKHGDHRVLNTLWYGVEKAGLTFDVNAKSTCGHTPLHIAAIHGHKNIIRLLVGKFNANVRLRDTAGKKAWQYLDHTVSSDIYQLLGAPPQAARRGGGGAERVEPGREQQPQRRRRHYFSTASSGGRPLIISGTKVKRSTSIAALLKHKSLHRFHGHQSDSSI